ncbi:transglutaminase-like domain-containing protein, partial [Clostridium algidicarnis]
MKIKSIAKMLVSATISLSILMTTTITPVFATGQKYVLKNMQRYKLSRTYELKHGSNSTDVAENIEIIANLGDTLNSDYIKDVSDYKLSKGSLDDQNVAKFNVDKLELGETKTFIVDQYFSTGEIEYAINKSNISNNFNELPNFENYLKDSSYVQVVNPMIIAKATELTKGLNNTYDKAFEIYKWVVNYLTYDLDKKYANKGALSALTNKRGVCQEYSQLFVALCRASGIPSRTVTGFRNNKPDVEIANLEGTGHMWAEVYFPSYGWVIVEPTITKDQKEIENNFGKQLNKAEHIITCYEKYNEDFHDLSVFYSNTNAKIKVDCEEKLIKVNDSEGFDADLIKANNLVAKTENDLTKLSYDVAMQVVNLLPNTAERTSLQRRLTSILKDINVNEKKEHLRNENIQNAMNLIIKAEKELTYESYKASVLAFNLLTKDLFVDINILKEMQNRLEDVLKDIKANQKADGTNKKALEDATALVVKSEKDVTRSSYDIALNAVNELSNSSDKTSLQNRLANVLKAIETKEKADGTNKKALEDATALVVKSEKDVTRSSYDIALNGV